MDAFILLEKMRIHKVLYRAAKKEYNIAKDNLKQYLEAIINHDGISREGKKEAEIWLKEINS